MPRIVTALAIIMALTIFAPVHSLAADHDFVNNNDGTVSDLATGLMWSAQDNQGDVDWLQARRWARFTFPTTLPRQYDNWRLPTTEELLAIKKKSSFFGGYESACGVDVHIERAFELTCAFVWSGETQGIEAKAVTFQRGYVLSDRKTKLRGYRALAVRTMSKEEMEAAGK